MPSTAGRGATVAAITAAVVATSMTALAAVGSVHLSHRNSQADLRTSVLGVGRQIAVDFAAYDYRHIDADFTRVASESTGQFRQQFVAQSAGVRELIIKAKAVSTAEVASEGLVDVSATTATVVLALDRTIRNTGAPKGQQDSFGLQIDLVRQHGRWLASKVTPL
jgi:Mce-associated membrane protein